MIHARAPRLKSPSGRTLTVALALAASVALAGAPARADVMEVGPESAVWVSGDLAGVVVYGERAEPVPGGQAEPVSGGAAETDGVTVPDGIIANVAAHAAGVPNRYAAKIAELSHRFDLSPSLLEAVVWQESRWREGAVSHAGARGLAATWARTGNSARPSP